MPPARVTHDMDEVRISAVRVVVIEKGRVIAQPQR
jgi:ABC-type sulfate/molybdate transport systems ATPase subunit